MLTQTNLDEIEKIVDDKIGQKTKLLPTKNEFFGKMDEVMGELKVIREEQTVSLAKVTNHNDQFEDHEVRMSKLEVKVATT